MMHSKTTSAPTSTPLCFEELQYPAHHEDPRRAGAAPQLSSARREACFSTCWRCSSRATWSARRRSPTASPAAWRPRMTSVRKPVALAVECGRMRGSVVLWWPPSAGPAGGTHWPAPDVPTRHLAATGRRLPPRRRSRRRAGASTALGGRGVIRSGSGVRSWPRRWRLHRCHRPNGATTVVGLVAVAGAADHQVPSGPRLPA